MNLRRHDRIALRARVRQSPILMAAAKAAMTQAAMAAMDGTPDAVERAQAALEALRVAQVHTDSVRGSDAI